VIAECAPVNRCHVGDILWAYTFKFRDGGKCQSFCP